MFNLLVASNPVAWDFGSYEFDKTRVTEYTVHEISQKYGVFDENTIAIHKMTPTLFVTEREQTTSKIGSITDIRILSNSIKLQFEFNLEIPEIFQGEIEKLKTELDIGNTELHRTHWAIKDIMLFEVLLENNIITQKEANSWQQHRKIMAPSAAEQKNQIFIVHGHDEQAKEKVEEFVISLDLNPIILDKQADLGKTIIEKIEHYSDVGYAIVLYTKCDIGAKLGTVDFSFRARQNVIFEHGYLIGKLSREKVLALIDDDVELPNDISGMVYIPMDKDELWKEKIESELKLKTP